MWQISRLLWSSTSPLPRRDSVKITFVVWERYHRRSDLLAQHLGATIHYIQCGQRARLLPGVAKYLAQALKAVGRYTVQTWQTWRLLRKERPDVVLVQNPPVSSVLAVYLYARQHGARYVVDSHTGAFIMPKWRWSVGLHRMLSRRALATIVHNKSQAEIVEHWGCRYFVLGFIPGSYPEGEPFPLDGRFNVAVVSTSKEDEPMGVVFEAAACLPDVSFYVTGDHGRLAALLAAEKPSNCHLTGYLPYERYVALLRGADVILDLTTQDHTLLMGAFEAVSLGTPLIVSDWPVLRDCFSLGTVHVPNTVEGVCEGVRRAQGDQIMLRRDILRLRDQLCEEWERAFTALQRLLQES